MKMSPTKPIESVGSPGTRAKSTMMAPTMIVIRALFTSWLMAPSAKFSPSLLERVMMIPVAVEMISAGI